MLALFRNGFLLFPGVIILIRGASQIARRVKFVVQTSLKLRWTQRILRKFGLPFWTMCNIPIKCIKKSSKHFSRLYFNADSENTTHLYLNSLKLEEFTTWKTLNFLLWECSATMGRDIWVILLTVFYLDYEDLYVIVTLLSLFDALVIEWLVVELCSCGL
jgi:hypothetical protein